MSKRENSCLPFALVLIFFPRCQPLCVKRQITYNIYKGHGSKKISKHGLDIEMAVLVSYRNIYSHTQIKMYV